MEKFEDYLNKFDEVGYISGINRGVVVVDGLPKAAIGELVFFETGAFGQVTMAEEKGVTVLMIENALGFNIGTRAARTGQSAEVIVGEEVLGAVIDPLGRPLDGERPVKSANRLAVDRMPPGIDQRTRINKQLTTGVAMVDLVLPLGKGQRELVIGDRKTGKTSFLLQTIRSQVAEGAVCVYSAIGKKQAEVKNIISGFRELKIDGSIVVVASFSSDSSGLIYLTPHASMTLAEYFCANGKDVLLVLDDLSTHAKFYREIALLSGQFPGRDSYPADIFYQHAKLLERAGSFKKATITCLPVAESTEGDITGLIQTNLMSMTDGHLFFDTNIFTKGRRPAVNPFLSVTRVGRQTQDGLGRGISHELSSLLAMYEKSESFSHFGAELSEGMKLTVATGQSVYDFFRQSSSEIIPIPLQYFFFALVWVGKWPISEAEKMREDIKKATDKFLANKSVRDELQEAVSKSADFNTFLSTIRKQMDHFNSLFFS